MNGGWFSLWRIWKVLAICFLVVMVNKLRTGLRDAKQLLVARGRRLEVEQRFADIYGIERPNLWIERCWIASSVLFLLFGWASIYRRF